MSTLTKTELENLRMIEWSIGPLRALIAIAPLWIVYKIISQIWPEHAAGFARFAFWLASALLVGVIYRQIMAYWFVGKDHRFLRDAKRISAAIAAWRDKRPIKITFRAKLFARKILSLVLLLAGWGLFLSLPIAVFRLIWPSAAEAETLPAFVGPGAQWSLAGIFVMSIIMAIVGGIKIIKRASLSEFSPDRSAWGGGKKEG